MLSGAPHARRTMAHVAPLTFLFSAPLMPRVSVQYDDVGTKPPVSKGTQTHTHRLNLRKKYKSLTVTVTTFSCPPLFGMPGLILTGSSNS